MKTDREVIMCLHDPWYLCCWNNYQIPNIFFSAIQMREHQSSSLISPHQCCFPDYHIHRCYLSVSRLFGMMRTPAKKETCSYSSGLKSKVSFRKSRWLHILLNDENPSWVDKLLKTRFAFTFLTWARLKGDSLLVTGDSEEIFLKWWFLKELTSRL